MNDQSRPPEKAKIDTESLAHQLVNVSEVHLNVSQEVIITTEDKVQLCLSKYLKRMERKQSWITPLGIVLAIALTLVTSSFRDIGLDAATWRAIFILGGIISIFWLVWSIKEAFQSKKIGDVVAELKKGGQIKTKSDSSDGV
jgi:K+-sensing histidine kinase KdpD